MARHGGESALTSDQVGNQCSPDFYISRCDERFIGYGGNKAACLFETYLSGVSYSVLADDFIIHQSHAYAEDARNHEVN